MSEISMGCVLGQHDSSRWKEHVIYYLSKKFADYETRYSMLEKTYGDVMALSLNDGEREAKERCTLVFDGSSNMVGHNNEIRKLQVYGDSQLVICQLNDEWKTKDEKSIPYHRFIKEGMNLFDDIVFDHILREENQIANTLATLASMFDLYPNGQVQVIEIEKKEKCAYYSNIKRESDGKPWFHDNKLYLEKKEYPERASENDKRIHQRLFASFMLNGNVLYKQSSGMILLRCVDIDETNMIMKEVHDGLCITHSSGYAMMRKII
ncbi:uncharacterized protein LOC120009476 [Tripterygium wilfordii]|uniref:uncharacterized protein LOC120009476 n=1 Tax=Tripterygium wilfordii TaxID=458696 RepID=UPI0018F7F9A1|nr:uncharacterized protein LOC120009476 [Tripterygium wilfordii]